MSANNLVWDSSPNGKSLTCTRLVHRNKEKKIMHSKIQSYRILDKYKNRGKACGLPVVKKIDFRFSRHWKLLLFRSKANLFTRFSNNTANIRVVKMWKLAKTYVWLIQPRKKLHQSRKCGPAIFSHVDFRGSTHVLRRFSQPISAGRVQMEAPAFSTLFSGLFNSL